MEYKFKAPYSNNQFNIIQNTNVENKFNRRVKKATKLFPIVSMPQIKPTIEIKPKAPSTRTDSDSNDF